MLSNDEITAAARGLDEAERSGIQMRQLSLAHPGLTIDDAYRVQSAWIDLKLGAGRRIRGRKIGLTSKAMQSAVNIDEPDYGVLLDDMFWQDGGVVATDRFVQLRAEAELAFVLKQRIAGPGCTLFDVLNATDYVVPAIEILDARIERVDRTTGATRKVVDTIADNAANCGIVIGGRPFRPDTTDLRWVSVILSRNGQVEETGVAAGVLNNPANGIVWLANRLSRHGIALEPGQVILSGSFVRPVDCRKGDTLQADYGPFGTVSCHFA
ncbi:2-oxo-hept-4-ene-1,7-dioate hydratase [Phreatobacter sp. AB_2022a]|uniref:2-oxo-hept-4-ene-1,7-dioate hydratase n=1 Tax=Phreatobacter sp. AB_2022a TaxID=3003134 RepID=UPI00228749E3|nr:2-oxo-hepta-3-ene-1,7-dioic acid hydratase [Phreatobacter sp. AB_2022a]MCZ0735221.1 2-oxo-hepta-3-ene-1,7-dioic acid hydratase [Phreatobacter sp. AB_2022a]